MNNVDKLKELCVLQMLALQHETDGRVSAVLKCWDTLPSDLIEELERTEAELQPLGHDTNTRRMLEAWRARRPVWSWSTTSTSPIALGVGPDNAIKMRQVVRKGDTLKHIWWRRDRVPVLRGEDVIVYAYRRGNHEITASFKSSDWTLNRTYIAEQLRNMRARLCRILGSL